MQFEARGLLDEYTEVVVQDAIEVTVSYHNELPPEVQLTIAVERAEGKLDGMYSMWVVLNEEERHDDAVSVINDLVGEYHQEIAQAIESN